MYSKDIRAGDSIPTRLHVRPAKTQISLSIDAVRSESSQSTLQVANNPKRCRGQWRLISLLIWVVAGWTCSQSRFRRDSCVWVWCVCVWGGGGWWSVEPPFDTKFYFHGNFWINLLSLGYHVYPKYLHLLLFILYFSSTSPFYYLRMCVELLCVWQTV